MYLINFLHQLNFFRSLAISEFMYCLFEEVIAKFLRDKTNTTILEFKTVTFNVLK